MAENQSTARMSRPASHVLLNALGQIPCASDTTRIGAKIIASGPGHHATNPAKKPQKGPRALWVQT